MFTLTSLSFLFLSLTFLSAWVRRDPKVWGVLLTASLGTALLAENLQWIGLIITLGWAFLWMVYTQFQKPLLFVILILLSFGFKWHVFPGYTPAVITPKFQIGLEAPLVGLFPLVLGLAPVLMGWGNFWKGLIVGLLGLALLAGAALVIGVVHWQFQLPSFAPIRYSSNLLLTAIPEEAFYRGFLQTELCKYWGNVKGGKVSALLISSLIFTLAHLYWSPSIAIFGFVFLASLIYGTVYYISKSLESTILVHFLLNFIHMTFFSYHAI